MADKYAVTNIPVKMTCPSGTVTGKISLSLSKMLIAFNNTDLEDLNKLIMNEEIRTPENVAYFKSLVLEVLQEQGLI